MRANGDPRCRAGCQGPHPGPELGGDAPVGRTYRGCGARQDRGAVVATPKGWSRDGTGGYDHPGLGSIYRKEYILSNYSCWGWFWYPACAPDEVRHREGPYPTLREAVQATER